MGEHHLSARRRAGTDTIYFYAVRNIYHPETKKQSKEQTGIGRYVKGRCYFREEAIHHADLFKGTPYERSYWSWRELFDAESDPSGTQEVIRLDSLIHGVIKRAGLTLVLGKIASETKLDVVLEAAFGKELGDKILSLAYYEACVGRHPTYLFPKWSQDQLLPCDEPMSDKAISEVMQEIKSDNLLKFQSAWLNQFEKDDCLCLDLTSISSYSRNISDVSYGYNRDHEKLPQINLLMIVSQSTLLPVWFEQLPGAIGDVSTIDDCVRILEQLKCGTRRFVLDRGFASAENIALLQKKGFKFTMGIPLYRFSGIRDELLKAKDEGAFARPECMFNMHDNDNVLEGFCFSKPFKLNGHRCYLHMYDCPWYRSVDEISVQKDVDRVYQMLLRGEQPKSKSDIEIANLCFTVKKTPVRGLKVTSKPEKIKELKDKLAGGFAILSNMQKDGREALRIYKLRDGIEKRYDDLKNDVDMFRLRVHSAHNMQSRLFVKFVAEVLRCAILNKLQSIEKQSEFFKLSKKSVTDLLWSVESLRQVKIDTHRPFYLRATKEQQLVLRFFGIEMKGDAWRSSN